MGKKIYDIKPPQESSSEKAIGAKSGKSKLKTFSGIVIAVVIISAVVFFFSFRVEVDIWPQTEGVEMERSFTISANNETGEDVLPGVVLETQFLEEEKLFEATGVVDEETRATGTIIIKNSHWDHNQPLVDGTRFETADGKIFKTEDGTVVPGRSFEGGEVVPGEVEVSVVADEPGEEYNIEPTEFTLPGLQGSPSFDNVAGVSETAMTGGGRGERTVISEEDVEGARREVINSLIDQRRSFLESENPDFVFDESSQYGYEVIEEEITGNIGETADDFSVKMRMEIDVITFREEDLRDLLIRSMLAERGGSEEVDNSLKSERAVYEDSLSFKYDLTDADWEEKEAIINVDFAGELYYQVDEFELKSSAAGRTRNEFENFLNQQDFIREAGVRFRPFGIGRISDNIDRIRININF